MSVLSQDAYTPEEAQYFDTRGGETGAEAVNETSAPGVDDSGAGSTETQGADNRAVEDAAAGDQGVIEGDGKQRTVPLAALHEERARRKEAEESAKALQEQTKVLTERMTKLVEVITPKPAAAPEQQIELPPIDKDPVGHIMAKLNALGDAVTQIAKGEQQRGQLTQQQQEVATVINRAQAFEREYVAANPDYAEAATHLMKSRDAELARFGLTPEQRQQQMAAEQIQLAQHALRIGVNPAQLVHDLARDRGYAPRAVQQNEGQSETTPAATAQQTAVKLAAVKRGQDAGPSLGQSRGVAAPPLTAQRLLEMSEGEFAGVLEQAKRQGLFG
jgi:hypothetical protein